MYTDPVPRNIHTITTASRTALVELVNSLLRICTKCSFPQPLITLYPKNAIIPHRILAALLRSMRIPRGRPQPSVQPRARESASTSISKVRICQAVPAHVSFELPSRSSNAFPAHVRQTYLGHLVPELPLCADAPRHGCDSNDYTEHNGGVCAPVLGLGVPTTRGRPDVLGVPVVAMPSAIGPHKLVERNILHVRDLGAAAHECLCGLHCCDVVYCAGICQSPSCIT